MTDDKPKTNPKSKADWREERDLDLRRAWIVYSAVGILVDTMGAALGRWFPLVSMPSGDDLVDRMMEKYKDRWTRD